MHRFLIIFFFCLKTCLCFSQTSNINFVPNGSFEETYCCDNSFYLDSVNFFVDTLYKKCSDSLYFATQPFPPPPPINYQMYYPFMSASVGWYCIDTSPDLFGICSSNMGSPDAGHQNPQNGNHYFGEAIYSDSIIGLFKNFHEFLETKLTSKLKSNQKYCVSVYVSLADYVLYSASDFGIYFSDTMFQRALYTIPMSPDNIIVPIYKYVTPQLNNQTGQINNRSTWRELSWEYTATGNEQYITLGNFKIDKYTDALYYPPDTTFPGYEISYIYIDNVSITELQETDAGKDTTICKGGSIQIGKKPIESIEYSWYPTEGLSNSKIANPIASPNQTTTYYLTMHQCRDVKDSITITVVEDDSPKPNAGNDTIICKSGTVTIGSGNAINNTIYNWQPSSNISNAKELNTKAQPANSTTFILSQQLNYSGCPLQYDTISVEVNNCDTSVAPKYNSVIQSKQNLSFYNYTGIIGIKIYNSLGQIIYENENYENNFPSRNNSNYSKLAAAIYYIKYFNNGIEYNGKIILE